MWRKVETAAIVTAMGWTWAWMSRPRNDVVEPRRRPRHRRTATRVFEAAPGADDPDGGHVWERRRRRRLID
jgi:hypothetical protein